MGLTRLLLVLLLGLGLGWWLRSRGRLVAANRQLSRGSIWALLAAMGAQMALHQEKFAQGPSLFLWALFSSLLLTALYFLIFWLWPQPKTAENSNTSDNAPKADLWSLAINAGCILAGFLALFWLPSETLSAWKGGIAAFAEWTLNVLLFAIGFDLGVELKHLDFRKLRPWMLAAPFLNIALTLGCGLLFAWISPFSSKDGLRLVSGLGWYSLSSVVLAEQGLIVLSMLAFIHNVFRELLAILTAPLAARVSPYLSLFLGGATSMDVMLPFVQRYAGREYTLFSFYSGLVCSLAVLPLMKFWM